MKNHIIEFIKQVIMPLLIFICIWIFCVEVIKIEPMLLALCFLISVGMNWGQYQESKTYKRLGKPAIKLKTAQLTAVLGLYQSEHITLTIENETKAKITDERYVCYVDYS